MTLKEDKIATETHSDAMFCCAQRVDTRTIEHVYLNNDCREICFTHKVSTLFLCSLSEEALAEFPVKPCGELRDEGIQDCGPCLHKM